MSNQDATYEHIQTIKEKAMSDEITCTVTIDLQSLTRYRQVGEDDYASSTLTLAEAVVEAAVEQLLPKLVKDEILIKVRDRITTEMIQAEVERRLADALSKPVRKTSEWGEPTGPETTIAALVDAEIKKQLTVSTKDRLGNGKESVLDTAIKAHVNTRLQSDLKDAFDGARKAMIEAAAETGKQALARAAAASLGV